MVGGTRRIAFDRDYPVREIVRRETGGDWRFLSSVIFSDQLVEQDCIVPDALLEIVAGILLHEDMRQVVGFFFRVQAYAH